ncbi:hypothetical protein [Nocardioides sp. URHA0032]|uniref:hypothetical protein n=1 Tax=Nocardioides sp. URHA0032 TaxID=1380388 RepID=UPI00048CA612|nr:hypothetical protein [Nocardioides sp. URHA0032]
MPIARRGLLGLGAAAALSVAVSGCSSPSRPSGPRRATSPTTTRPRETEAASRPASAEPAFAGCPAPTQVYFGASLPADRSVADWEATLGASLAVHRSYFTPDQNEIAQLAHQCADDLAHDRLPHVSMKPPGTWAEVASGGFDAWLTELLGALRQQAGPVFLTIHHEPENDVGPAGMAAPDYVAMQRHVIRLAGDLAPSVTTVPVLQHWTFDPLQRGTDPRSWIVPEAAVLGVDVYNPWSPTNGKPWRTFGSRIDEVLPWIDDTPLAIGEYGCREDPSDPGSAAAWLRDAAEYARTHGIVSMSYFNSGVHAPDGSLELHGPGERAFAELLGSPWVARPT